MIRLLRPDGTRAHAKRSARAAFLFVFAASAFMSGVAFAEIRVWVDEAGVMHFSDDPGTAPVSYTHLTLPTICSV